MLLSRFVAHHCSAEFSRVYGWTTTSKVSRWRFQRLNGSRFLPVWGNESIQLHRLDPTSHAYISIVTVPLTPKFHTLSQFLFFKKAHPPTLSSPLPIVGFTRIWCCNDPQPQAVFPSRMPNVADPRNLPNYGLFREIKEAAAAEEEAARAEAQSR